MLPLKLYSGQNVKKLDSIAIDEYEIPGLELMNRAGQAAFNALRANWPTAKHFAIVCGNGNNGGDGFTLARLLEEDDLTVTLYQVGDLNAKLSGTAELAKNDFVSCGGKVHALPTTELLKADVIVDAILGTGLRAPLKPDWLDAIGLINRSERPVLAIDIPSGIDGDSGAVVEQAVHANVTVTYMGLKYALLTGPALDYTGELLFDDLGVPEEVYHKVSWDADCINLKLALDTLPTRRPSSHKGDFGHVLIIGAGIPGYSGAVSLAGQGALYSGAGLASAIVHPKTLHLMSRAPHELMCHAPEDDKEAEALFKRASIVAIGPGLSQNDWAQQQFKAALSSKHPLVVDADALNLLAANPVKRDNWVLTPHPGEAATLLGISTEAVQANRLVAANRLAEKYGGIIVLKGAGTVVASVDKTPSISTAGNPGMASGGMGDILSGLIASLIAQGLNLFDAAKLAVVVHASAADIEQAMGERGMLASDLLFHIRSLLNPSSEHEQPTTPDIFDI